MKANRSIPTGASHLSSVRAFSPVAEYPAYGILGCLILPFALLLMLVSSVQAIGIPEPSLVLYGTVRNTARFNARVTTGTLQWTFVRQEGVPRTNAFTTVLSNVVGQFSFVLELRCETLISGSVSSGVIELLQAPLEFNRSLVMLDGSPVSFVVSTQALVKLSSRSRGTIERVDFTINVPCQDADGRGLCDDWETQFFGNTGHFPNVDEDGDDMTNLEECIAGTNPNDADSVFQFIAYEPYSDGGIQGFRVAWNAADARSYTLLRSTTLLPGSFSVIASNIIGLPPRNTFFDSSATPPGPYFYNLLVEP